jgi:hypothetical protein
MDGKRGTGGSPDLDLGFGNFGLGFGGARAREREARRDFWWFWIRGEFSGEVERFYRRRGTESVWGGR